MKRILVLNDDTEKDWEENRLLFKKRHLFSYGIWGEICKKEGVELVRSSWRFFKGDFFEKYWAYTGNKKWVKRFEKIKPEVIYDKCEAYDKKTKELVLEKMEGKKRIGKKFRMINSFEFNNFFESKLNQVICLREFMPRTRILRAGEVEENLDKKIIVLKKYWGSGGSGIQISSKEKIFVSNDCLIQEFIGINNSQIKDTRIVFVGEEPVYAVSRIAPKGLLKTNISQEKGVEVKFVRLKEIKDLLCLCDKILSKLNLFEKKTFTLDFIKDEANGKYYLIELNTKPGMGFFNEKSREILEIYLRKLNKMLLE